MSPTTTILAEINEAMHQHSSDSFKAERILRSVMAYHVELMEEYRANAPSIDDKDFHIDNCIKAVRRIKYLGGA